MRISLLTLAAVCALSGAAHADTVQLFNLNATLYHGTATGTVSFDQTTGLFTGGSITATYNSNSYVFNSFQGSESYDTITFSQQDTQNGNLTFQLAIPGASDKNYAGGYVCSDQHSGGCQVTGGPAGDYYYTGFVVKGVQNFATTGTLTATPEPTSLALLGTGLLGAVGAFRKRFL